jgi:hypothetical protein
VLEIAHGGESVRPDIAIHGKLCSEHMVQRLLNPPDVIRVRLNCLGGFEDGLRHWPQQHLIAGHPASWIGQQARKAVVTAVGKSAGFDYRRINPRPPVFSDQAGAFDEMPRPKV